MQPKNVVNVDEMELEGSTVRWQSWAALMASIFAGALLATVVLPAWLPGLAASLFGAAPKAFWFLSRGSAMAAFGLLWLSMALGLLITSKAARLWPGGPAAFDLHEYASLLGMAFGLFHGLILMGDQYIHFTLAQVLVPFASTGYKPLWVGLGQLSFYLWGIVNLSFYVRKQLGNRSWRLVHYASYLTFALALAHGIFSGSDSGAAWAAGIYWIFGGSLLFLLFYRILASLGGGKVARKRLSVE
ncbi:MAG TPA: hypothetical protein VF498_05755 [Anaerolineales bacterium]